MFKLFVERLDQPNQDDKPRESEILGVDELQELIQKPDMFKYIRGVPRILGLKYTDTVAELKMAHGGDSLQGFINNTYFQSISPYHKACIAFDLFR